MEPHDADPFVGRDGLSDRLLSMVLDPNADDIYQRSIVIEGPPGRGKTWLLDHLSKLLAQQQPQPIVCRIKVARDFVDAPWKRLAARICLDAAALVGAGALVAPLDRLDGVDDEVSAEPLFEQSLLGNILDQLAEQVKQHDPGRLIVLLIDGLEEHDADLLRRFEYEFLETLFRHPHVRVVATRRVDSQSHRWKSGSLRSQTVAEPLDGFDAEEERQALAARQQMRNRVKRKAASGVSVDAVTDQLLGLFPSGIYAWGNPRANRLLADAVLSRSPLTLAAADVEACLRELLRPPRTFSAAEPAYGEDQVFQALCAIVAAYPTTASVGVARFKLSALLQINDREREQFLAYLQHCGIGYFKMNSAFVIHRELVQLCTLLAHLEHGARGGL
jgi:hypothetical protein